MTTSQSTYSLSYENSQRMLKRMAELRESLAERASNSQSSSAEAQYDSRMVSELDPYVEENLTVHDYILRMSLDAEEQVQLMKQGLQMLLDIFATKTNEELSTDDKTMQGLLMEHLDLVLVPTTEFMQWYFEKVKQLDAIEEKIELAKELSVSVPPLNYIGRIIMSMTDDTEQKVIANYGGKSWRRIENFLRGTTDDNPDYIPGRKFGEEYVELRESNVPVHSHSETLIGDPATKSQEWATKEKSGNPTKLVNTPLGEENRESIAVKNTSYNYQISPLEYTPKAGNDITLPHDNLPPYLKVYIWECTALTDEERKVTGEPDDGLCVVTWLPNNGSDPIRWRRRIGN